MQTVDQEIYAAEQKFVANAAKEGKPFFVWFNTTRMHVWTHLQQLGGRAARASASIPTVWSNTTTWSAEC